MTLWERHVKNWRGCQKCTLSRRRKKVVLARGKIPCDVLFIGEAPGHSENIMGKPFIGPAGKLMEKILEKALDGQYDYALTNLVACIPLGENDNKLQQPPEECIEACEPRLQEFLDVAIPDVVITVGRLAEKHFVSANNSIVHPAAMLRMPLAQKSLAIQQAEITISETVFEAFE